MKNILHIPTVSRLLRAWLPAALCAAAATAQTTHQSIALDCGGYFSGLTAHSSGRLYGYGDTFGAFRSDDSGTTWRYLFNDLTENMNGGRGIAVASGNADVVYYLGYTKLIKSVNGGTTWSTLLGGLTSYADLYRGGSMVFVSPANNNEVWIANAVGTTGGLSRSPDGGTTWNKIGGTRFDNVYINSIHVRTAFPNQVWVAGNSGLLVSNDAGSTWSLVWNNNGQPTTYFGAAQAGQISSGAPAQGNKLLFGSNFGVWRVTATDWTTAANYTVTKVGMGGHWVGATVLANGSVVSSRAQDNMGLLTVNETVESQLPRTLLPTFVPIWTSAANIQAQGVLGYGTDQILQDPRSSSRWYCTGGMGPAVSTDAGQTWRYSTTGLAGVMTTKVMFSRTNQNIAFVPASDVGITVVRDTGTGARARYNSASTLQRLHCYHDIMESDGGRILIGAGVQQEDNRTIIITSADTGRTWTEKNLASSGLPASSEGITRSVMSASDANDFLIMLGQGGANSNPGIWRTTNGGTSFTKCTGIPDGLTTGMRYHQENAFLARDGVLAAVRYTWIRGGGFYRSTDNGAAWTKPAVQPFNGNWVWAMAVDRATASRIWVAGQNYGLIRSDDGGISWSAPVSFFSGGTVNFVDAANGAIVVLGRTSADSFNKIYYSADNGSTWTEQTGPGYRYSFANEVALNPWRPGQIWVSGVSVNVIRPQVTTGRSQPGRATPTAKHGHSSTIRVKTGGDKMMIRNGADLHSEVMVMDMMGRVVAGGSEKTGTPNIPLKKVSSGIYPSVIR